VIRSGNDIEKDLQIAFMNQRMPLTKNVRKPVPGLTLTSGSSTTTACDLTKGSPSNLQSLDSQNNFSDGRRFSFSPMLQLKSTKQGTNFNN
jgi:hypothetical protein